MKNYRWGIIGPGKIANKFAVALTLAGGAQLDAIASRDGSRAHEFAEKFNIPRYYDNYEALVKDPDIDAIYVSTPHAFHCDQTILALTHGKPVLCEKPMALTQREVGKMVQAARDNNVFLMEAMWTRFLPHTERILELVRSGRLGAIKYIRADFGFAGPYHPDNRLFNLALGGGALLDIGIYPLFLCLLLLGEPQNILASGKLAVTGADESSHALLQYQDGATAVISSTFAAQTAITAEIAGTDGLIQIPTAWYKNDHFILRRPGAEPEVVQMTPMVNGFEYQIRELMQCVDKGLIESPSMSHDFSLLLSRTMDNIRRQIGVRYPGE
ncbi:MAG: Gfo/Idh/MocA family oxidoreductase [Chitinophagaceae bacterium]|nr:Gfo/Idh/MocA family oxidoreductase [Chitinophagaceae bacterium]